MTISLTCACGVRLEVDDTFAGQTINCPDCQRPLATPKPERAGVQTSGFAIASLTLALVGAFTLIGTVLAVLAGVLALLAIRRDPDRVTGKGYAVAGIVLGAAFTGLTVFAFSPLEVFGVHNLLGRARWAGQLDYNDPDQERCKNQGFTIKRPSPRWGVKRLDQKLDPHIPEDLLMVNLEEDAHLLCFGQQMLGETDLEQCRKHAVQEFEEQDRAGIFGGKPGTRRASRVEVLWTKRPPPVGQMDIIELLLDKKMQGQQRRFLMQVRRDRDSGRAFVLLGGARKSNFDRLEPEIREAMKSFEPLPGG
jgi:hypothetical protein